MTELARYSCSCGATWDVWLVDGRPERRPLCPDCLYAGWEVLGRRDGVEEQLYGFQGSATLVEARRPARDLPIGDDSWARELGLVE